MALGNESRAWTYEEYVEKYDKLQAELAEYKDALAEKFSDVCKTCMNVFFPKLQTDNKRLKTIDSMFKEMYPKRYLIVEGAVEFAEQALKDTT